MSLDASKPIASIIKAARLNPPSFKHTFANPTITGARTAEHTISQLVSQSDGGMIGTDRLTD
jgi:hypothetical protein